jgi:hypothetical protein
MYTCDICNYETDVRTAIYNHNKTKKHIHNLKIYEKKVKEVNAENELLKQKNKEIEELKQKLIEIENEKDKEIAKLEVEAKIYKELSEKSKNVNR